MISIERLLEVKECAVAALEATKVGTTWNGAANEAVFSGYERGTVEFGVFCAIYGGAIKSVTVDNDGDKIIDIQFWEK